MRWRGAVLAVALLTLAPAARAQGTGFWWAGLGLSIPSGNTGDGLSSGWLGSAGVGWDLPQKGWSVQGEGYLSSNPGKGNAPDLSMVGLLANLAYNFDPDAEWQPYAYGGLGWMSSKRSGGASNSDIAMQLSGGMSYKASDNLILWAEIRYVNVGTGKPGYAMTPIAAGISMPWGKKP